MLHIGLEFVEAATAGVVVVISTGRVVGAEARRVAATPPLPTVDWARMLLKDLTQLTSYSRTAIQGRRTTHFVLPVIRAWTILRAVGRFCCKEKPQVNVRNFLTYASVIQALPFKSATTVFLQRLKQTLYHQDQEHK